MEQIKNIEITTSYTISSGIISPNLEIKGDLPDGTIEVNSSCEVAFLLSNNNFTGTKDFVGDIVITDGSTNVSSGYKEAILNGADPVITGNLVPVTIDSDGTVRKANINEKWYSYEEKMWANAVILTNTGKIESNGIILENSIESYFVWIPRYKYKIFDTGNYTSILNETPSSRNKKPIEIVFENKSTSASMGNNIDQYLTHPAFVSFDTNGFWVAKFETSGTTESVLIKPNQTSLRSLNVKTMFEIAYNYKRTNDSHMMKNTEWGAVAYLTLSDYGVNQELNINNNSNYLTGYAAHESTNQSQNPGTYGTDSSLTVLYNTSAGYRASTTGNITGIYDMSGGANEYMASFVDGSLGNSGFESDPTITYGNKYFDKYASDCNASSYNKRILGDATGEIGPFYYYADYDGTLRNHSNWYKNSANFAAPATPWFTKGGYYMGGSGSGILNFDRSSGKNYTNTGFRIVLGS